MDCKEYYEMEIAGLKRRLPLFKVNDELMIAAFILFGDVEMTVQSAAELLKRIPPHDIMLTAEAKSIPLIHEMARQSGAETYIIARKAPKVYMRDILEVSVKSITTAREQRLCLGSDEAALMRGRRVLIVDDVISTGESVKALEKLVEAAGGTVAGKAAVLAEGSGNDRSDVTVLGHLPLFNAQGDPIL